MDPQQNPYEVPNSVGQTPPRHPQAPPSAIPKVFGIIHIVYAAIGGLMALLGLGGGALMKAMFQAAKDEAEKSGKDIEPLTEAVDSLMSISIVQSLISIAFAVLLLVAGIKLLKYQAAGRKLSNIWALGRMVVVVPLAYVSIEAQTKVQDEVQKLSEVEGASNLSAMMGIGGMIGVVLVCIYPMLSLVFVNQVKAKESLK